MKPQSGQNHTLSVLYALITLLVTTISPVLASPVNVISVDFESVGTYSTEPAEYLVSPTTYFTRTSGLGIAPVYNASNGNFFAASNVDSSPSSGLFPAELSINDIDITGFTDLRFSFAVAGVGSGWDGFSDLVQVEAQIDNISIGTLFSVQNLGALANAPDVFQFGIINQGTLNSTFTAYESAIFQTGDSLDLTFSFRINSNLGEDIAIDDILVTGITAVPLPATLLLFVTGLCLFRIIAKLGQLATDWDRSSSFSIYQS